MTSFDQRDDLFPREVLVEADQHPALGADVGWNLVRLGVALDEHRLHADRRADGQREHAVAVMVVGQHRELAVLREPARLAVAESFGDTFEREASRADLRERRGMSHHL